jgi:hypothetical protein
MIFLIILSISLIQTISTQTSYEEKCFDIDSTDSKLECSGFDNFYNIFEANETFIFAKPNRYNVTNDMVNFKKILNILVLNKNDDGNGTYYGKDSNNIQTTNIYNTLIYSRIMKLFNHSKFKCINV